MPSKYLRVLISRPRRRTIPPFITAEKDDSIDTTLPVSMIFARRSLLRAFDVLNIFNVQIRLLKRPYVCCHKIYDVFSQRKKNGALIKNLGEIGEKLTRLTRFSKKDHS